MVGFGIIGCGNIAPYHAEALKNTRGAKLVAVSDVVEKNVTALAERFNAVAYTDFRKLLERKDIDAVSLCVPSGMRLEIGAACAASGKHILSEKPLEVTTKRIDKLIAAVDKAGVMLGCVFQSRFADGPQLVRKAIDQGRFGRLVLGDAYIKWYRSPAYYASGAWRGTRKLDGGGALMNQGIHQIDLLLWFFGKVKKVQARTALVGHECLEVEDLACAQLEFESGAFGVIEGSTACWPGHSARIEVHGTEGGVVLEDGEVRFWQFQKALAMDKKIVAALGKNAALGSGASDPTSKLTSEGHRRQIQDFVRAISEKRPPFVDGREGRRAVELIEAIYTSARNGGKAVSL